MSNPFYIYECEECVVAFAVEQAFEDQSIISCPACKEDEHVRDVCEGELTISPDK